MIWWLTGIRWSVVWKKSGYDIAKVMVTVRAHIIKIWLFLLYHQNCWSFSYQTLFYSTLSWSRVSKEKVALLCSRSQQRLKKKKKNLVGFVAKCHETDGFWILTDLFKIDWSWNNISNIRNWPCSRQPCGAAFCTSQMSCWLFSFNCSYCI